MEHKYNIMRGSNVGNEHLSEKVSVNINASTLSGIDLLVDNGYFSNRSDFINQALRESLQKHRSTLDRIIEKNSEIGKQSSDCWFIGVMCLEKRDVEAALRSAHAMAITGYGVLMIGETIDEQDLFAAVRAIRVKGKVVCNKNIKAHYGLK